MIDTLYLMRKLKWVRWVTGDGAFFMLGAYESISESLSQRSWHLRRTITSKEWYVRVITLSQSFFSDLLLTVSQNFQSYNARASA